jgi:hypothetical protein
MPKRAFIKENVLPKDFDVSQGFMDSQFQNFEKESIARNIVLICQWSDNQWLEFTWDDYQRLCTHKVAISEKAILDGFVEQGLLGFKDGKYAVLGTFIMFLDKFIIWED